MEGKRKQIIQGLRMLKEECNKILDYNCHANCPYEDICLAIKSVGYGAKPHGTPDMWDFQKIKDSVDK